jgi:uncharacterized protein YjbI with pentapeptide repeats
MAFSFKSLFTGSRTATLPPPSEDTPQETAIAGADAPAGEREPAPSNDDPLQQALLKEFLAQEFLTNEPPAPPPDVTLPPALEAKLGLSVIAVDHTLPPAILAVEAIDAPKIPELQSPATDATSVATKSGTSTSSPKPVKESPKSSGSSYASALPIPKVIEPPPTPEPAAEVQVVTAQPVIKPEPPAAETVDLSKANGAEPVSVAQPAMEIETAKPAPSVAIENESASEAATTLAEPVVAVNPVEAERAEVPADVPSAAAAAIQQPRSGSSNLDLDELLADIETPPTPQLTQPSGELFEANAQTLPALADVAPDAYVLKPRVDPSEWALEETLAEHKEWIDSKGASGHKADLRKGNFDSTELISVNLRHADLQDINLKAADLLLADLRDACLVRANFNEACLVGTNLEGANLEGASLENSMGLVSRQLAGTNLHEASLPASVLEFRALADFARTATTTVRIYTALMFVCAISLLMIFKTRDVQLLSHSGILSFLPSRALAAALPSDELYLVAPVLLLAAYVWFLYNLQRVWDAVLELPAVFPDGRLMGAGSPRIILGLMRNHFRWMNEHAPSTRRLEKTLSVALAYWAVPVVLLAFWARYLTVQDLHGTLLQEVLLLLGISIAFYCTTQTGRPAEAWLTQTETPNPWIEKLKQVKPVKGLAVVAAFLTFLSLGTIYGVPYDMQRAPQYGALNIRRWAPTLLHWAGIDPYAELTESSLSRKPAGFDGSDAQLSDVSGARLVGSNFRFGQLYGAFLANAHLFRSNFDGAFMAQADMRNADLSQSTLDNANLDRAAMTHVNLDRASLEGATLSRTDLRAANLSYTSLRGASLIDARMEGTSLYGSHLENASLIRGNLNKADLRDAHLDDANLEHSDLREAYFWSAKLPRVNLRNAQLATAIFIDADLTGADMSGAQFNGTVLNGANLHDVNLDGADLRGALQLSAAQVCSAKSRRGALMDDALFQQVDTLCSNGEHPVATVAAAPNESAASAPAASAQPAAHK